MAKPRENGEIGIFSLCLPVDMSYAAGCCQNSWSHAKAQRRKVRTEISLFQQFSFAPLREVKAGIDEPFENGLIGIISFCLPVSLTPFHHPSFALPGGRGAITLVECCGGESWAWDKMVPTPRLAAHFFAPF
jgi:hypothetical protein